MIRAQQELLWAAIHDWANGNLRQKLDAVVRIEAMFDQVAENAEKLEVALAKYRANECHGTTHHCAICEERAKMVVKLRDVLELAERYVDLELARRLTARAGGFGGTLRQRIRRVLKETEPKA